MEIKGLTFIGTRTEARADMGDFVGRVLGLRATPVTGMDAEVFAMPDGSSFAVTSSDGPEDRERTVGFLVDDVILAARELTAAGIETDDDVSSSDQQRYIHFRAPDGHLYELVEEIG